MFLKKQSHPKTKKKLNLNPKTLNKKTKKDTTLLVAA